MELRQIQFIQRPLSLRTLYLMKQNNGVYTTLLRNILKKTIRTKYVIMSLRTTHFYSTITSAQTEFKWRIGAEADVIRF